MNLLFIANVHSIALLGEKRQSLFKKLLLLLGAKPEKVWSDPQPGRVKRLEEGHPASYFEGQYSEKQ